MKNVIKYYYNIEVTSMHQNNDQYEIFNKNKRYILIKYKKTINELKEKYSLQIYLQSANIPCHIIVKNIMGEIITVINNENYVMVWMTILNRIITFEDIKQLTNMNLIGEYRYIKKSTWQKLWKIKMDYFEYEMTQLNKKYPLINESINYYIGIVEICISMLENLHINSLNKNITHERITNNMHTDYFYNPLHLIIDNRTRDAGEFLKTEMYNTNYNIAQVKEYITNNSLTEEEIILLLVRLIYPSTYFDLCEKIIDDKIKEKELLNLINSSQSIEMNLKKIYRAIKDITKIPEIEWLEKTNLH